MSGINQLWGGVVAFVVVGIILLGIFLTMPSSYDRLNEVDLGPRGNATLDSSYDFIIDTIQPFGVMFMVLAGIALITAAIVALTQLRRG